MLQNKVINNISELKNGFTHTWLEPDFISSSLKCFSFSRLCNTFSGVKGYTFEWIMTVLLSMLFIDSDTIHSMLSGCVKHHIKAGKDTFYRLKNKQGISWRTVLWLFIVKFKKLTINSISDFHEIRCQIFDDTLLEKTGRYIEKISRGCDHVTKRSVLGFKLLVMGYWDGMSFIPVDFSLHREVGKNKEKPYGLKKKELRRQHKKDRKKGSYSLERAEETDMSKIACAIKMFKRAMRKGLIVDYVLMDSWFT